MWKFDLFQAESLIPAEPQNALSLTLARLRNLQVEVGSIPWPLQIDRRSFQSRFLAAADSAVQAHFDVQSAGAGTRACCDVDSNRTLKW